MFTFTFILSATALASGFVIEPFVGGRDSAASAEIEAAQDDSPQNVSDYVMDMKRRFCLSQPGSVWCQPFNAPWSAEFETTTVRDNVTPESTEIADGDDASGAGSNVYYSISNADHNSNHYDDSTTTVVGSKNTIPPVLFDTAIDITRDTIAKNYDILMSSPVHEDPSDPFTTWRTEETDDDAADTSDNVITTSSNTEITTLLNISEISDHTVSPNEKKRSMVNLEETTFSNTSETLTTSTVLPNEEKGTMEDTSVGSETKSLVEHNATEYVTPQDFLSQWNCQPMEIAEQKFLESNKADDKIIPKDKDALRAIMNSILKDNQEYEIHDVDVWRLLKYLKQWLDAFHSFFENVM